MQVDNSLGPSYITVDLAAIKHNVRQIRSKIAAARIMAVVKANAYGHGLVECGRFLESIGIEYLGVARVEEGIELRKAGVRIPIHVFAGICGGQIGLYLDYDLDLTVSSQFKLDAISAAAQAKNKQARVHIKVDTGLNRIGTRMPAAASIIEHAAKNKRISIVGIFSHFASAEDTDSEVTRMQLERFLEAAAVFDKISHPMPLRHIANSAALLNHPASVLDMVRPGIALYGVPPTRELSALINLKAALSLRSEVVFFKVVLAGSGVSYGHTWRAPHNTRVVTIPIGYADGYPRRLSNRGEALINGKRYPVIGTVCMDQTMIAINSDEAYNGDEVVLIGAQGAQSITVLDLSERIGTIPHEVLACLPPRIPRIYTR